MKKRSEKQQDLDNLKTELARVSTVILTTFQGITVENDTKLRRAVQAAGGKDHLEYWIPAEELPEFNRNIVGPIEVIRRFPSAG